MQLPLLKCATVKDADHPMKLRQISLAVVLRKIEHNSSDFSESERKNTRRNKCSNVASQMF